MKPFLALLLVLGGCTEAVTEMVVVVNKYGLTIGRDVDALVIVVRAHPTDPDPIFSAPTITCCVPRSGDQPDRLLEGAASPRRWCRGRCSRTIRWWWT